MELQIVVKNLPAVIRMSILITHFICIVSATCQHMIWRPDMPACFFEVATRPQGIMLQILLIMLFRISLKNPSLCSLLFFLCSTLLLLC